jgi:hypothetical protein
MPIDWTAQLLEQLTFHWDHHLRPHLDGMTDEEYLWEPVPGCWSIRPREEATSPMAAGGGAFVADWEFPDPSPAPFTTIAWRLAHISISVFGERNASHFAGPPVDYQKVMWPATARDALAMVDEAYERWVKGASSLSQADLARAVGPREGMWAEESYAALVLHINREVIHHGAEVLTLRDLYRNRVTESAP